MSEEPLTEEEIRRQLRAARERLDQLDSIKVQIDLVPNEQAEIERGERRRGFGDGYNGLGPRYPNDSYWEGYEMGIQAQF